MSGPPDVPRVCDEIHDWSGLHLSKEEACCPVAACVQSIIRRESIKRCEIGTKGSSVLSQALSKSVHPRSFTDSSSLAARHKHMPALARTCQPYDRVGESQTTANVKGRGPDGKLQLSFLGHRSRISNSLVTHTA
jgi:hypothetical protein